MAGPRWLQPIKGLWESPLLIITDRSNPPKQTDFTLFATDHTSNTCYQTGEKPPPQVFKVNMKILDCKTVFISLCILHLLTVCDSRPIRKRTVSEVQLMHNVGEHRQVQERLEWLQLRLRSMHAAPARGSGSARRRLRPEELPDLSDLSPEEIQFALNLLEKLLLKSKRT